MVAVAYRAQLACTPACAVFHALLPYQILVLLTGSPAGALAENPRVLLLDELTTFLDVEDQFGVLEAVRKITHKGSTLAVAAAKAAQAGNGNGKDGSSSANELNDSQLKSGSEATTAATANASQQGNGRAAAPLLPTAVTAIWVTHRFEELEYADSASYMEDGQLVFTGTPAELKVYLKKLGATV